MALQQIKTLICNFMTEDIDLTFTVAYYKNHERNRYVAKIVGVKDFEISNENLDHLKEEVQILLPQVLPHIMSGLEDCIETESFDILFENE